MTCGCAKALQASTSLLMTYMCVCCCSKASRIILLASSFLHAVDETAPWLVIELAAGTARRSACVDGRVSYTLKQLAVVFAQWPSLSSRPGATVAIIAAAAAGSAAVFDCPRPRSPVPGIRVSVEDASAAVSVVAARWRHGPPPRLPARALTYRSTLVEYRLSAWKLF